ALSATVDVSEIPPPAPRAHVWLSSAFSAPPSPSTVNARAKCEVRAKDASRCGRHARLADPPRGEDEVRARHRAATSRREPCAGTFHRWQGNCSLSVGHLHETRRPASEWGWISRPSGAEHVPTRNSTRHGERMKVGIVGCGQIASVHIPYVRSQPETTIVGCYDANPTRARETAERFGIANVCRTLTELIET